MKASRKAGLGTLLLAGLAVTGYLLVYAAALFEPEAAPVGYVGQPEVSNNIVSSGNERLYAIDYNFFNWSGNLHSYSVSTGGAVGTVDNWDDGAAHQIDLQNWDTARKIVTVTDSGGKVPFRWGSLSAAQKTALDSAAAAAASSPVLDFIRGNRSNEKPNGLNYRARATVLGDIIHSTPVYCAAASCTQSTVFVGANDGMLHAIDAANGAERFAYIPSLLIAKLPFLKADPFAHRYFVDGQLALRKFGSTTLLVGALGGGGKGLFALDVTDAAPSTETAAASKILWEITSATSGYGNLGYVYGTPVLATVPAGGLNLNAAVVGNGYNNTGNGHAVLYLINASTGAKIAEIDTGSGSTGSPNGLSAPTLLDQDVDGIADYAYAGDIDGNLWKFNLSTNAAATLLYTTSPAQAITMAPGLKSHPNGGYIVTFATGRMFEDADESDTSTHAAYGIWEDAPVSNTTLLAQTLTEVTYGVTPGIRVRKAGNTAPNWAAGGHKGWRTPLPIGGERVVGDGGFVTGSVFLFMATNPTVNIEEGAWPTGENWWMQLNALTGGDNGTIRFDLNGDLQFTGADQLTDGAKPVGRHMGGGVRSQLTALSAAGVDVFQSNFDRNGEPAAKPVTDDGPGVSGGHFDFDIYYYDAGATTTTYTPTSTSQTKTGICAKSSDVTNQLNALAPSFCKAPFSNGFGYMTDRTAGAAGPPCGGGQNKHSITCNTYTSSTSTATGDYKNKKHVHEYDDIYDVTGVNMLNASDALFNLSPNVILSATATTPEFKILVMNQFLNPAAKLSVGGAAEVNVKNYNGLASQTDATALLTALPIYSRATVNSLAFNLPLTAFQSKDWWGTGGDGLARAGLIPTQTGCVNKVNADGSMKNSGGNQGLLGPNGQRFNGSLTLQLIKANTPASALELNHSGGDVRYGWRVKQSEFKTYVVAEYTSFWHHPNGACYGQAAWVPNPPQDEVSDAATKTPAAGSNDPKDGVFSSSGGSGGGGTGGTPPGGGGGTPPGGGTGGADDPPTGIVTGGTVDLLGTTNTSGVTTPPEALGRVNWRELRQ